MGAVKVSELRQSVSGKRAALRQSHPTRHAADWPLSDVSSDLTVEVGTANFSLHKFPLVSRSGKIRKLLSEAKDPKVSRINIQSVPGGPEAFELAAKFCYGKSVEITLSNVATLRCAADFLQMTEEVSEKNLERRTESFLRDIVFCDTINSITVLHHCEDLLPVAEETNLVGRLVAAIVSVVCKEQLTNGLSKLKSPSFKHLMTAEQQEQEAESDWWGEVLAMLNLDFFQRVLSALKSNGLKQDTVCRILINYAQHSLRGLVSGDVQGSGSFSDAELRIKQRLVLETVVGLLPTPSRKNPVAIAFLSGLLKAATVAAASATCKADLERRVAMQLDRVILEDILVPVWSRAANNQHQLYDTDSVLRIFSVFLSLEEEVDEVSRFRGVMDEGGYEYDSSRSPRRSSSLMMRVSKVMDSYLAEIALDSNLMPSKFIALAELLPDHSRFVSDGLYRAVDIFLKVHPNMKEPERYRLCKAIDCQKLSQEACSHAAQNERLPVQMAVQVLHSEQIRLRNAMTGGVQDHYFLGPSGQFPQRSAGSGVGSGAVSPRDNYASVRRENRELKLEVARMRMRLTDLEKDHVNMRQELVRSNPASGLLRSFTKKLGKLSELFRLRDVLPFSAAKTGHRHPDARFLFQKKRHNNYPVS